MLMFRRLIKTHRLVLASLFVAGAIVLSVSLSAQEPTALNQESSLVRQERELADAQEAIVGYTPGNLRLAIEECKALGLEIKEVYSRGKHLVCRWAKLEDLAKALPRLRSSKIIKFIEPNGIIKLEPVVARQAVAQAVHQLAAPTRVVPNDPLYGQLWGMENIHAPQAWHCVRQSCVVVAVVDTGIDYNHPDLKDSMWRNPYEKVGDGLDNDGNGVIDDVHGYNAITGSGDPLDDNKHGTHCAGIIAAAGNNGIGVVGVNWRTELMAVKFLNSFGSGSFSDAVKAIDYASYNGAKIINASWGSPFRSQAIRDAVDRARAEGVLFVAAAGNNGGNNDVNPFYPASYGDPNDVDGPATNVIAVAAIDKSDTLAWFSNYGKRSVHLAAPGVDIFSTLPNNMYGNLSGTSMAAPHVTGAAALLLGHPDHANSTYRDVRGKLLMNTRRLGSLAGKLATEGTLDIAFLCPPCINPPQCIDSYCPQIVCPDYCPDHRLRFRLFRSR